MHTTNDLIQIFTLGTAMMDCVEGIQFWDTIISIKRDGIRVCNCCTQQHNNLEMAKLLLEHGGDPNIINKKNNTTTMYQVSLNSNVEMMKLLMENKYIKFDFIKLIDLKVSQLGSKDSPYPTVLFNCAINNSNDNLDCIEYLFKCAKNVYYK